ncbi:MAG: hypothetical protein PHU46_02025 [Rhodocyclaceae bacterium]|nr:hypothetical protein [Rhodocyclaceae bacterium]
MNTPQPISPRRRLQDLLAIPEYQRTDEQWDEINELEISLASANRLDAPREPGARRSSPETNREPGARRKPPEGREPGPRRSAAPAAPQNGQDPAAAGPRKPSGRSRNARKPKPPKQPV